MSWGLAEEGSCEEIQDVVVDILAGPEQTTYEPSQCQHLLIGVGETLERREDLLVKEQRP